MHRTESVSAMEHELFSYWYRFLTGNISNNLIQKLVSMTSDTFFSRPSLMKTRPGTRMRGPTGQARLFWMASIRMKLSCCLMCSLMWLATSETCRTASAPVTNIHSINVSKYTQPQCCTASVDHPEGKDKGMEIYLHWSATTLNVE